MNNKTLQILNLFGFVLVIVLNTLANTLPINGLTTGALSDFYPNLFVPAGFTFSIWGLIYLLLLAFSIYQLKDWRNNNAPPFVQQLGLWFMVSCFANASWILAWHHQQTILSLLIMLMLLSSLIIIYLRLGIGTSTVRSPQERWLVQLPFSVYLGWITVATIANVTTVLVDKGWTGGGIPEVIWVVIMLGVATFIGLLMLIRHRDIAYVAVLIWAFYGIYSKQSSIQAEDTRLITSTAIIGITVLTIGSIIRLVRR